jgi:hypothetical protein
VSTSRSEPVDVENVRLGRELAADRTTAVGTVPTPSGETSPL